MGPGYPIHKEVLHIYHTENNIAYIESNFVLKIEGFGAVVTVDGSLL